MDSMPLFKLVLLPIMHLSRISFPGLQKVGHISFELFALNGVAEIGEKA
jgi:hypothetical protein